MDDQECQKNDSSLNYDDKAYYRARVEFFYKAIENTQKIIQSVDIKLHILLVFLGAQIAIVVEFGNCVKILPVLLFFFLWIISFLCIISGIVTVNNPDIHIKEDDIPVKGFFYGAYLFNGDSKMSLSKTLFDSPKNKEQILRELVYEHTKLIYIRELKTKRQRYSVYLFVASVLFSVLFLFWDKIHRFWSIISNL